MLPYWCIKCKMFILIKHAIHSTIDYLFKTCFCNVLLLLNVILERNRDWKLNQIVGVWLQNKNVTVDMNRNIFMPHDSSFFVITSDKFEVDET